MSEPTSFHPHAATAPPRRRRRWRPWLILLGISVGWKVIVLTLGAALPRWIIGDGLDLVPIAARDYAEQAKLTALSLWDHPIERLGLVRALRVVRVDSADATSADAPSATVDSLGAAAERAATNHAPQAAEQPLSASCKSRSVTVRAYTFFAIPYSEARTVCDTGVIEYRVFRRRS